MERQGLPLPCLSGSFEGKAGALPAPREGSPASPLLFADAAWRQRAHQRTHHRQILLAARQALSHQVVRSVRQVILLQRDILAEAMEEGQLEVRRLAKRAMRADLNAVAAEDTAIKREGVARQVALGHHQRTGRADLHAGAAGNAVRIVQADVKRRRDDGIEALAEHAVAVGADHVVADAHALRTVDALVGIAQNEAMRQIHIVVVVVARLAIMEAIIGQAVLDAVLLQVALTGSRAGALQAAARFTLGLLAEIAHLDEPEVALAVLIRQHRHLHLRLNRLVGHDIEEIRLALLQFQAARHILHILAHQEGMDRACAELALGDALDDRAGADLRITASKDTRAIRHIVVRVRLDRLPLCPLHPRFVIEHRGIRVLPEGRDHGIALHHKLGAFDGHRAAAPAGIRLAELVALEFDARDMAVFRYDSCLADEELHIRTLGLAIFALLNRCADLVWATAIHRMNLRAQAQRGARAVEGRKAAAQHDDLFGLVYRHRLALNLLAEIGDGVDEALSIVAWDWHLLTRPAPDSQVDGIKALSKQVIDGEIDAQLDVTLEIDAQLPDVIQLAIHHILLETIFRDTIAQHATRLRLHIEDLAIVALERQIIRAGQARGTGADNRHLLARRRIFHERHRGIEQAGFRRVTMHAANSDLLFDQRAAARLLARRRAGQAQDIGEGQHLFDQARGLLHRAFGDQFQIAGDVDMRRAIDLAGRLTVGIVVGEHHFQVRAPDMEQLIRVRCHDHAGSCGRIAGRQWPLHSFDMHKAHTTGRSWLQLFIVTQIRDIGNTRVDGRAQDRLTLICLHLLAIDGEGKAGLPNIVAHHRRLRLRCDW